MPSPEPLQPHPGARETDPFFSTGRAISQDEADEAANPNRSLPDVSASPSSTWLPDPGSAFSAHVLQVPGIRGSLEIVSGRRDSSQSISGQKRRKPTRTDSGREFWGLPEMPRRQKSMLGPAPAEDSSAEEDDDEVLVGLFFISLLGLTTSA